MAHSTAYWMTLNPDTFTGTQVSGQDRGRVFAGTLKRVYFDNQVDRVALRFTDGVEITVLPETVLTVRSAA